MTLSAYPVPRATAIRHTLRHALRPWERRCGCKHIGLCVICGALLPMRRAYADVCGDNCFARLTELRGVYRGNT